MKNYPTGEIDMNKEQYVPDMMGCSDGSCIFEHKPRGTMVTNGGCSCQRELRRTEEGMKAVRTINFLRRNWPQREECDRPGGCVCGGDTLRVRQGCGYYVGGPI